MVYKEVRYVLRTLSDKVFLCSIRSIDFEQQYVHVKEYFWRYILLNLKRIFGFSVSYLARLGRIIKQCYFERILLCSARSLAMSFQQMREIKFRDFSNDFGKGIQQMKKCLGVKQVSTNSTNANPVDNHITVKIFKEDNVSPDISRINKTLNSLASSIISRKEKEAKDKYINKTFGNHEIVHDHDSIAVSFDKYYLPLHHNATYKSFKVSNHTPKYHKKIFSLEDKKFLPLASVQQLIPFPVHPFVYGSIILFNVNNQIVDQFGNIYDHSGRSFESIFYSVFEDIKHTLGGSSSCFLNIYNEISDLNISDPVKYEILANEHGIFRGQEGWDDSDSISKIASAKTFDLLLSQQLGVNTTDLTSDIFYDIYKEVFNKYFVDKYGLGDLTHQHRKSSSEITWKATLVKLDFGYYDFGNCTYYDNDINVIDSLNMYKNKRIEFLSSTRKNRFSEINSFRNLVKSDEFHSLYELEDEDEYMDESDIHMQLYE